MLLNLLVLYTFIITLFKEIDISSTSANVTLSMNASHPIQNVTNATNGMPSIAFEPHSIVESTLSSINLPSTVPTTVSHIDSNKTTGYQNLINSVLLTTAVATAMSSEMNFSADFSSSPSTFTDMYDNTTIELGSTDSTWNSTTNSSMDDYYGEFDNSTEPNSSEIMTTMPTAPGDSYNGTANEYEYYGDRRIKRIAEFGDEDADYTDDNGILGTAAGEPWGGGSTPLTDAADNENETTYSSSEFTTDFTTEFTSDGSTPSTDYSTASDSTVSTDFTTDSVSSTFPSTEFDLIEFETSAVNEQISTASPTMLTMPVQITDEHTDPVNFTSTKETHKICWETRFGQELVKLTVLDLVISPSLIE